MKAIGISTLLLLFGCFNPTSGPWDDLESVFKSEAELPTKPIIEKSITLTSTKHKGAFSYKNIVDIRLSKNGIDIDPGMPFMNRIRIPVSAIHGCSKTCFGTAKWDADIIISQTGTEISIPLSQELLDWCWNNHLPAISSSDRRKWLYNKVPLPDKSKYQEQLSSKQKYTEQLKQSCMGY